MNHDKKFLAILTVLSLGVTVFQTILTPDAAYADRNSPPDESVRPQGSDCDDEIEERLRQMEAARQARARAAAAARKKAAVSKQKADAERAAAEKKAAEEAARVAAEEAVRAQLSSGRNLIEEGRFQTGLNVLRDFVRAHPHSADAWYWISRAHHAMGDYDRAQTAVNIALEIDPYYPALTKTPNGIQPSPKLTKQQKKDPRPSMSVLPVKPWLPSNLALEPVTISFPRLIEGAGEAAADDTGAEVAYDPATGARLRYEPYPPLPRARTVAWMQEARFQEISRWRFRVDRMGILTSPRVPIAWKGTHPYEVYFWTGTEWARVRRQRAAYENKETYDDILAHAEQSIARIVTERGYEWDEYDTPSLAANASLFRYTWIGDVALGKAQKRAEQLAKEKYVHDSWDEMDPGENN